MTSKAISSAIRRRSGVGTTEPVDTRKPPTSTNQDRVFITDIIISHDKKLSLYETRISDLEIMVANLEKIVIDLVGENGPASATIADM